jgi:sugar lactone lactonase YvrE
MVSTARARLGWRNEPGAFVKTGGAHALSQGRPVDDRIISTAEKYVKALTVMTLGTLALGAAFQSVRAQDRPTLEVRTLAGPIEAGSGGLEVDPDGNVYTADFGATLSSGPPGTRVWRVTTEGEVSVFAEGLLGASGNALGADGWFYQSNIAGNTISRISPDGVVEPFVTGGVSNPVGLVFDADDRLIVANCGNGSLARVGDEGTPEVFTDTDLLRCPNGITLASDGNFYVANFADGNVVRVTPGGEASVFATIPGNNNGHIVFGNGVLYVVARGNHQIYELTLDGELTLIAGSGRRGLDDGPADEATLSLPNDVALSPDGRTLYWNDVGVTGPDPQTLTPTWIRYVELRPRD